MKGTPVIPPVHLTATYRFDTSDDLIDVVQNRSGYLYSRWDNPTVKAAEEAMAELEGYTRAVGFGSGMAAISTAVMAHVHAGSRIVTSRQLYGGTFELFNEVLKEMGVDVVFVDCDDISGFYAAFERGVTVLYLESPTNPLLRVLDIPRLAEAARKKGAAVMLDATFASPVNMHPADFGVDMTIHSATKFLGGHHDITAGFVCCNPPFADRIWHLRKILGGVMDPMTAFLVMRGLKTLELRVQRQNDTALTLARFLDGHPKVSVVHYPGLPSHPDHPVAKQQMTGFGGMLSFELIADFEATKQVMDRLAVIKLATSLGGVTSLANQPMTNTHAALSPEERSRAGIGESLVRLSVGIEPPDRLMADLDQALAVLG